MPCRDASLIVGGRSGCIGCPCALAGSFVGTLSQQPNRGRDALAPGTSPKRAFSPERGHIEPKVRALGWQEAPLAPATTDGRLVQAALLAFGAPLLLLLLSAVGAAAFASNQPLWALAGLASLPGIAALRRFPITSYTSTRND